MKLAVGELREQFWNYEQWYDFITHARKPDLKNILTIRTALQQGLSKGLADRGFLHPPTYLFSTCVDPLNHETESPAFGYYGQEISAVQSLIFHKMAVLGLTDIEKVFWVSPNIRKEKNVKDKKRYATEFTQIDFEAANLSMEAAMKIAEDILVSAVNGVIRDHAEIIEKVSGRYMAMLPQQLKRIDAVKYAEDNNIEVGEVEADLAGKESQPFFLTNLKREAYDRRDDETGAFLNFDIIMPKTGEILSGAEREHTLERLTLRMQELSYPMEYFKPILTIAKEYGLKPSAGGGFGLERLTRGVLLLDDLAEVYPFRRVPEEHIIF